MSWIFHRFTILILSAVLLAACACVAPKQETLPADTSVHIGDIPKIDAEHLTLTGDVLKVTIYGEDDLSGEYTVGRDGKIALPLVGAVAVDGQPLSVLPQIISDAYRNGYLVDPKVSVEVKGRAQ